MRRCFLAAALAVAACVGFTTPAGAQSPARVETPDPPPVARQVAEVKADVSALKAEVVALKRQVAALTAVTFPAAKAADECPCPVPASLPAATVASAAGHTHTCARGHTWDHSMDGGSHRCPVAGCGLTQFVQDSAPRPVAYTLGTGGSVYSAGSGCANGACAAPPVSRGFGQFRRR